MSEMRQAMESWLRNESLEIGTEALNNWLQCQQKTSLLRQRTVCEMFPERTKDAMMAISIDSAEVRREKGTAITKDYTLGPTWTGTEYGVAIVRPEGTIGTYHTHPHGLSTPSPHDVIDAIFGSDKFSCIGATDWTGTKIACYTPVEPEWSRFRHEIIKLREEIAEFNKAVTGKYKERGEGLARVLREVNPAKAREAQALELRRRELADRLERQILYTGYKEEWRPYRKVNGWEPEPLMMDKCKLVWEKIEEIPLLL